MNKKYFINAIQNMDSVVLDKYDPNIHSYDVGYKLINEKHACGALEQFKFWCDKELIKLAEKGYLTVNAFKRSLECKDLPITMELWEYVKTNSEINKINPIYSLNIMKWATSVGLRFNNDSLFEIINVWNGGDKIERIEYLQKGRLRKP